MSPILFWSQNNKIVISWKGQTRCDVSVSTLIMDLSLTSVLLGYLRREPYQIKIFCVWVWIFRHYIKMMYSHVFSCFTRKNLIFISSDIWRSLTYLLWSIECSEHVLFHSVFQFSWLKRVQKIKTIPFKI